LSVAEAVNDKWEWIRLAAIVVGAFLIMTFFIGTCGERPVYPKGEFIRK
jgi:hypothetical protein